MISQACFLRQANFGAVLQRSLINHQLVFFGDFPDFKSTSTRGFGGRGRGSHENFSNSRGGGRGRGSFDDRSRGRGSFNGDRGGRGSGRGRGSFSNNLGLGGGRGSFSDRGGGRGGRGSFSDRGGRGRGAFSDRGAFGGRGRGFAAGGERGGFRGHTGGGFQRSGHFSGRGDHGSERARGRGRGNYRGSAHGRGRGSFGDRGGRGGGRRGERVEDTGDGFVHQPNDTRFQNGGRVYREMRRGGDGYIGGSRGSYRGRGGRGAHLDHFAEVADVDRESKPQNRWTRREEFFREADATDGVPARVRGVPTARGTGRGFGRGTWHYRGHSDMNQSRRQPFRDRDRGTDASNRVSIDNIDERDSTHANVDGSDDQHNEDNAGVAEDATFEEADQLDVSSHRHADDEGIDIGELEPEPVVRFSSSARTVSVRDRHRSDITKNPAKRPSRVPPKPTRAVDIDEEDNVIDEEFVSAPPDRTISTVAPITSSRASQPANSRSASYDNTIFTVTGDRSSFPAAKYASTATTPSQRDEFLTDKPERSTAVKLASSTSPRVRPPRISIVNNAPSDRSRVHDENEQDDDVVEIDTSAVVFDREYPTVIAEQDTWLVVNKPLGMAVHAGSNIRRIDTLTDWLATTYGTRQLAPESIPPIRITKSKSKSAPSSIAEAAAALSANAAVVLDDVVAVDTLKNVTPSETLTVRNVVAPTHRLDRFTTGAILCARNPHAARFITCDFEAGRVQKEYLAIVHGVPRVALESSVPMLMPRDLNNDPVIAGSTKRIPVPMLPLLPYLVINAAIRKITFPVTRAEVIKPTLDKKSAQSPDSTDVCDVDDTDEGYDARTWVNVLASNSDQSMSLVLCAPLSGRLHQIRAHMAHIGHRLFNDGLYADPPTDVATSTTPYLLHAWRMSLPDPNRLEKFYPFECEAPLPRHFTRSLLQQKFDLPEIQKRLAEIRNRPLWYDFLMMHGSTRQKRTAEKVRIRLNVHLHKSPPDLEDTAEIAGKPSSL